MLMVALTVPCFMNLHNPQGHELRSLTHANGNSKLDATLQRQRGFTQLLTPCWKVTAKRSRVQSLLLSCPCCSENQHQDMPPLATPPKTPLLLDDIIVLTFKSGRVWRRMEPVKGDSNQAQPQHSTLFINKWEVAVSWSRTSSVDLEPWNLSEENVLFSQREDMWVNKTTHSCGSFVCGLNSQSNKLIKLDKSSMDILPPKTWLRDQWLHKWSQ